MICLLAGGLAIYWFLYRAEPGYAERILPENTTACLIISDTKGIRKKASETLLWKSIENSPRKEIYRRQWERIMSLGESATGVDPRSFLTQLSGEVSAGYFPAINNHQGSAFIVFVKNEKEMKEFLELKLDPALKRRMVDLKMSEATHEGILYRKYSSSEFPQDFSPCYFLADHHFVLSHSEAGIKMLLEVRARKAKPLRDNASFRKTRKETGFNDGVFLFINAHQMLRRVGEQVPERARPYWPGVLSATGIEAVHGMAYKLGFEGDGFGETMYVYIDEKRDGLLKIYLNQKPQKLNGLDLAPAESRTSGAGTLPSGIEMWKEFDSQISKRGFSQLGAMLKLAEAFTGINLQHDLIEPLGNEFAFALGRRENGVHDSDAFLVAFHLRSPDHFRTVLKRLAGVAREHGMVATEEVYQGKEITIVDSSAETGPQPAFFLDGSWFYFSTDYAFLKQSIDARKNGSSVSSLADYSRVTSGFPGEVNGISYTNTRSSLQRIAEILEKTANTEERRWIREYGLTQEINELSQKLFGSASFTLFEKEGIRYHAYSSVPSGLLILPAFL